MWFLYAKPSYASASIDSNYCDNYNTVPSGNAHCQGLYVALNNVFMTAGRVAPVLVCVYGLSAIEMPGNKIVIFPIHCLSVGLDQNRSLDSDYIVFICGKYNPTELNNSGKTTETDEGGLDNEESDEEDNEDEG